jgi:hypothetical protein
MRYSALRRAFSGRMIWSLTLTEALQNKDAISRLAKLDKTLLSLKICPGDNVKSLSSLMDVLPAKRVHLDLVSHPQSSDTSLQDKIAFTQTFYDFRCGSNSVEKAYKEMEKWFGKNLKALLGA